MNFLRYSHSLNVLIKKKYTYLKTAWAQSLRLHYYGSLETRSNAAKPSATTPKWPPARAAAPAPTPESPDVASVLSLTALWPVPCEARLKPTENHAGAVDWWPSKRFGPSCPKGKADFEVEIPRRRPEGPPCGGCRERRRKATRCCRLPLPVRLSGPGIGGVPSQICCQH